MAKLLDENLFELKNGTVICLIIGRNYTTKDGRTGKYTGCSGDEIALQPKGKEDMILVSSEDVEDADVVTFKKGHRPFTYEG